MVTPSQGDPSPRPGALSLAGYLRTSYRPDCDYIEGRAAERNVGLYPHSRTMTHLTYDLDRAGRPFGVLALPSVRVRVNASTVLVPDVTLLRRSSPCEAVIVTPPLLCIEVLAPEDTSPDLQWRVDRYHAMGVEHIWAVDPWKRRGWLASTQGFLQPPDGILRIPGTPIAISLAELFTELDES